MPKSARKPLPGHPLLPKNVALKLRRHLGKGVLHGGAKPTARMFALEQGRHPATRKQIRHPTLVFQVKRPGHREGDFVTVQYKPALDEAGHLINGRYHVGVADPNPHGPREPGYEARLALAESHAERLGLDVIGEPDSSRTHPVTVDLPGHKTLEWGDLPVKERPKRGEIVELA